MANVAMENIKIHRSILKKIQKYKKSTEVLKEYLKMKMIKKVTERQRL